MGECWRLRGSLGWKIALLHAAAISALILGLFYHWFAVADRYVAFLYGHLGATPFDEVTRSRYWMSGLVATGLVMVGYTAANWLLGRIATLRHREYRPPSWWQVWAICSVPLAIGIPFVTMAFNRPTLPPFLAAACVLATLVGLALALMPGSWAAQRAWDLAWLMLDGAGLMPILSLLRAVEMPGRGLTGSSLAVPVAIAGTLGGVIWLVIMTGLRAWRRRTWPGASTLFPAGLGLSYLLMPLVHYLFFTPRGYRYITTASNFFAFNGVLQLVVLLVAAILAAGVTRVRQRLPSLTPPSLHV